MTSELPLKKIEMEEWMERGCEKKGGNAGTRGGDGEFATLGIFPSYPNDSNAWLILKMTKIKAQKQCL